VAAFDPDGEDRCALDPAGVESFAIDPGGVSAISRGSPIGAPPESVALMAFDPGGVVDCADGATPSGSVRVGRSEPGVFASLDPRLIAKIPSG